MRTACDGTWRSVCIPFSAGRGITRPSIERMSRVPAIELLDDAPDGSAVDLAGQLAQFRVMQHLPALRGNGNSERQLVITLKPGSTYGFSQDTCACWGFVSWVVQ